MNEKVYAIARAFDFSVIKHLETLEAAGLIEHVMFGKRIRFYKFNETSSKAITVRNLIEIFET